MRILICKRENHPLHSGNWTNSWIQSAKDQNFKYETADLLSVDAINILRSFDCLLWHFDNYNYEEMLEARSILYSAKQMGLKVFPDFNDSWHFDDKVAQMYALQACNAPIPQSFVFYNSISINKAIEENIFSYPIVGKLRTGSGSHNVKMLKSEKELKKYSKQMLGVGYNPAPSLLYKSSSNIRSSHNLKTFILKAKRIPEFLRNLKGAKKFPNEKGYVYLQEFIPNEGFDMKVVVVGDKITGLHRPIRSYDFRASGGGTVLYDKSLFTKELINSAFTTADALHLSCVGFDYVINKHTNKYLIVEMSYGFSHTAILGMGGYFDRDCIWHDEPLNVPVEILNTIIQK